MNNKTYSFLVTAVLLDFLDKLTIKSVWDSDEDNNLLPPFLERVSHGNESSD